MLDSSSRDTETTKTPLPSRGGARNFDTILFLQLEAHFGLHAAAIPITSRPLTTMSIRLNGLFLENRRRRIFFPWKMGHVTPLRARGAIRESMHMGK